MRRRDNAQPERDPSLKLTLILPTENGISDGDEIKFSVTGEGWRGGDERSEILLFSTVFLVSISQFSFSSARG